MRKNKKKKFRKKDPDLELLDIGIRKFFRLPPKKVKRKRIFRESDLYILK